jgi:hypothetical protein
MANKSTDNELQKRRKHLRKEAVKRQDTEKVLHHAHRDLSRKTEALKMVNQELSQYAYIPSNAKVVIKNDWPK